MAFSPTERLTTSTQMKKAVFIGSLIAAMSDF